MSRVTRAKTGWLALLLAGLAVLSAALAPVVGRAEDSGLVRVDLEASSVIRARRGGIALDLRLERLVPWRVMLLDAPARLALDFEGVAWGDADPGQMVARRAPVEAVRSAPLRPGWTRLVLDLAHPQLVRSAEMRIEEDGAAHLRVVTRRADAEDFAAEARREGLDASDRAQGEARVPASEVLIVALDPGHGGIDPGAVRGGVSEAALMLALAREVADALAADPGIRPMLTRETDHFVPLEERMSRARAAGAGLLVSLHADAVADETVTGASVYRLSGKAQEAAADRMARRHSPVDLLAGLDLSGAGDEVATALMDLAWQRTAPRSATLQRELIAALSQHRVPMAVRPARQAKLAVLMAADIPSVLIETGFLSNPRDRALLSSPEGRRPIVEGIRDGLRAWRDGWF